MFQENRCRPRGSPVVYLLKDKGLRDCARGAFVQKSSTLYLEFFRSGLSQETSWDVLLRTCYWFWLRCAPPCFALRHLAGGCCDFSHSPNRLSVQGPLRKVGYWNQSRIRSRQCRTCGTQAHPFETLAPILCSNCYRSSYSLLYYPLP